MRGSQGAESVLHASAKVLFQRPFISGLCCIQKGGQAPLVCCMYVCRLPAAAGPPGSCAASQGWPEPVGLLSAGAVLATPASQVCPLSSGAEAGALGWVLATLCMRIHNKAGAVATVTRPLGASSCLPLGLLSHPVPSGLHAGAEALPLPSAAADRAAGQGPAAAPAPDAGAAGPSGWQDSGACCKKPRSAVGRALPRRSVKFSARHALPKALSGLEGWHLQWAGRI